MTIITKVNGVAWFVIIWMKKNESTPTGAAIVRAKTREEAFQKSWKTDSNFLDKNGCSGTFDYKKISSEQAKKMMLGLI
jgi:hypothetical protein